MPNCNGRLINAYVSNPNMKSSYSGFEIITCREISDPYTGGTIIEQTRTVEEFLNVDKEALDDPFYRIFGIYKLRGQENKPLSDVKQRRVIADFYVVEEAVIFLEELTGCPVNLHSE